MSSNRNGSSGEIDNRHDATTPRNAEAFAEPDEYLDKLAERILDAAFKVHRTLGPGLLESVYECCMLFELHRHGLQTQSQVHLPVNYDGCKIDAGLRLDLLVEDLIIVEIKAVEGLLPVHHAQVLTYLKLTDRQLGLLINFNEAKLSTGIKRVILSKR